MVELKTIAHRWIYFLHDTSASSSRQFGIFRSVLVLFSSNESNGKIVSMVQSFFVFLYSWNWKAAVPVRFLVIAPSHRYLWHNLLLSPSSCCFFVCSLSCSPREIQADQYICKEGRTPENEEMKVCMVKYRKYFYRLCRAVVYSFSMSAMSVGSNGRLSGWRWPNGKRVIYE